VLDAAFIDAMRAVMRHPALDAAFKELVLTLPSETYISEQLDIVDPPAGACGAGSHARTTGQRTGPRLAMGLGRAPGQRGLQPGHGFCGRRALAGLALSMLCLAARHNGDVIWPGKAYQRFKDAGNMTDRFKRPERTGRRRPCAGGRCTGALSHALFQDEALVLDKWFALQAGAPDRGGDVLPKVRQLLQHPDFTLRNPNRARSVIFSYCSANPGAFHRIDAAGYVFWSERVIELDAINPQVAARLARALDRWKKLAEPYRNAAREAIARVAARNDLSNDVREVVTRALAE
jgi:aminopeptidase N